MSTVCFLHLSPSVSLLPRAPLQRLWQVDRGESGGQKRPLVLCLEQASLPTHAHTHIHQTRTYPRAASSKGVAMETRPGREEGMQRDRWCRGGMDDGQGLILVFKCLSCLWRCSSLFFFLFFSCFSPSLLEDARSRLYCCCSILLYTTYSIKCWPFTFEKVRNKRGWDIWRTRTKKRGRGHEEEESGRGSDH